ncbi:MAG: hypothetical protein JW953_10935 [Anaerolineae bacterium]|nr:hypothetical protein [Anaerolineae bacterium]
MNGKDYKLSWVAFVLFYLVLASIVTILDWFNHVLTLPYWGAQIGLITVGVGVFAIVGIFTPDLSAARGVFLAFTVGILTIIPAVLMGLGKIPGFWPQYFYIAFGMAAGSFLTFVFLKFSKKITHKDQSELESDHLD